MKCFLSRHLFTTLAVLVFSYVGLKVDQIRKIIEDVYADGGLIRWLTVLLFMWGVFVLLRFRWLTPDDRIVHRAQTKMPSGMQRVLQPAFNALVVSPLQLLYWIANAGRAFSQTWRAALVISIAATGGLSAALCFPLRPSFATIVDAVWPLWGGFGRMVGLFIAVVSLWLLMGSWVGADRVLDGEPEANDGTFNCRVRVWRRTGEVLSALLILIVALEIVWVLVELNDAFEMTVYTVWAFVVLAMGLCFLAALVDFLHRNTDWPWRLIAVMLMFGLASLPSHVELTSDGQAFGTVVQSVEGEMGASLAGTGEFAADQRPTDSEWTKAAIERLEQEPDGPVVIVAASGGGSRAALAAVLSLEVIENELTKKPGQPACVWLCSGVSGGGIALAAHYRPGPTQVTSREDVTNDFLGPMFRGFIIPFSNRGEALTAYWDRYFEWDKIRQTTTDPSTPLLVYGVTDIDVGRRVMVGFPRLPEDWYQRWTLVKQRGVERWILSDKQHIPYSLSALSYEDEPYDLSLTRAVRMSSSFPFGFEPTSVRVDTPDPSIDSDAQVHLLDGGMVDNTGLDSVVAILSEIFASETPAAKLLAESLTRRGVFLIEIDAGAGSGEVTKSGPLSRLTQPFGGYNRGVYSASMRARDENIEKLRSLLGEENFVHEPIEPDPASAEVTEIMTTLALPRHDISRLTNAFERPDTREAIRSAIGDRYSELTKSR